MWVFCASRVELHGVQFIVERVADVRNNALESILSFHGVCSIVVMLSFYLRSLAYRRLAAVANIVIYNVDERDCGQTMQDQKKIGRAGFKTSYLAITGPLLKTLPPKTASTAHDESW